LAQAFQSAFRCSEVLSLSLTLDRQLDRREIGERASIPPALDSPSPGGSIPERSSPTCSTGRRCPRHCQGRSSRLLRPAARDSFAPGAITSNDSARSTALRGISSRTHPVCGAGSCRFDREGASLARRARVSCRRPDMSVRATLGSPTNTGAWPRASRPRPGRPSAGRRRARREPGSRADRSLGEMPRLTEHA
jgi:hypothetical protein